MCVGVAAECARLHLMVSDSASTKRFLFLIMPKRRECAKEVKASKNDLNMWYSWLLTLESVMGCGVSVLALGGPLLGEPWIKRR